MTKLRPGRVTVSKINIWFCIPRSLISIMVLTRATLEKLGEGESIYMFLENYEKLSDNVTKLTNQLAATRKDIEKNGITGGSQ